HCPLVAQVETVHGVSAVQQSFSPPRSSRQSGVGEQVPDEHRLTWQSPNVSPPPNMSSQDWPSLTGSCVGSHAPVAALHARATQAGGGAAQAFLAPVLTGCAPAQVSRLHRAPST